MPSFPLNLVVAYYLALLRQVGFHQRQQLAGDYRMLDQRPASRTASPAPAFADNVNPMRPGYLQLQALRGLLFRQFSQLGGRGFEFSLQRLRPA